MFLYWITTRDHHEDCFVVSDSSKHARFFFESSEGYNPGDSKATRVEQIRVSESPEEGYPSKELLSRLGYKIISEDKPIIYAKDGRTFLCGCANYSAMMNNLQLRSGVYCIRCAGSNYIKLGQTRDLHMRVKKLQTGCPYRLIVDFFIPYEQSSSLEQKLHKELAKFRTQFEWFDVPEENRTAFYAKARKLAVTKLKTGFHEYIIWSP